MASIQQNTNVISDSSSNITDSSDSEEAEPCSDSPSNHQESEDEELIGPYLYELEPEANVEGQPPENNPDRIDRLDVNLLDQW